MVYTQWCIMLGFFLDLFISGLTDRLCMVNKWCIMLGFFLDLVLAKIWLPLILVASKWIGHYGYVCLANTLKAV